MCLDLISHNNRVSMGVTPIKTRIRAKGGKIIKIIIATLGGTIKIACHHSK